MPNQIHNTVSCFQTAHTGYLKAFGVPFMSWKFGVIRILILKIRQSHNHLIFTMKSHTHYYKSIQDPGHYSAFAMAVKYTILGFILFYSNVLVLQDSRLYLKFLLTGSDPGSCFLIPIPISGTCTD